MKGLSSNRLLGTETLHLYIWRNLYNMMFCIQASNPRVLNEYDKTDDDLSSAIETAFPMMTEDAIMVWHNIHIPLSYKYDISYMVGDILNLLKRLREDLGGEQKICWLPDTFRSDWIVRWKNNLIDIEAYWEDTAGDLSAMLNNTSNITLAKQDFIYEWKQLLGNVINGLRKCGYNEVNIAGMAGLVHEFSMVDNEGILYRN